MILFAPRSLAVLAAVAAAVAAHAQTSLEAFQGLYEGVASGDFTSSDGHGGANDATNPFTVSRSFTGQDRSGATRTMTVTGSAYSSSTVGKIHIYGQGKVANAYYSPNNRPVIDSSGNFDATGSPYQLAVHGNAGWTDTLTYQGLSGLGYTVNYIFRLEGSVSGDTEAGLNFYTNRANDPFYSPRTKNGYEMWATPAYAVEWGQSAGINVDFYAGLTTNLIDHTDGSTINGTANYANTLTLDSVVVRDAAGRIVTNYTIASASGFAYPKAVPEPASLVALGLGAMAFLRRRKQA